MKNIALLLALLATLSCSRPPAPEEPHHAATAPKDSSSIEMSSEAQSHIGLQVATAEMKALTEFLSVTGTVQPIDNRVIHIRPLSAGKLTSVGVRVGDRVTADQTLATYDNLEATDTVSQLQTARTELERLNVQLAVVRQQTERSRQLADIGAIPRKEYELNLGEERSLTAGIQVQESIIRGLAAKLQRFGLNADRPEVSISTAIRAPFSGVVIAVDAAPGETIGPESQLFHIADISEVWVQAEVYEKDLGRIQLGRTASIRVDTYPDREFRGRVSYIGDILDPQTRTVKVRCDVTNPEARLKLDMFATVHLPTTFNKQGLAVPAEAIQQVQGRNVVFVKTGPTMFERKTVQIGSTVQDVAEVLAGLAPGEQVVTKGAFHLKSIVLGEEIGEDH
jgi:cobalt-zinc-cadmium efflux system membrane fusion protein